MKSYNPILVSQGAFFQWDGSPLLGPVVESLLRGPRPISGFELSSGRARDLLLWAERLVVDPVALPLSFSHLKEPLRRRIVSAPFLPVHLPGLSELLHEGVGEAVEAISTICRTLPVHEFTIHPDGSTRDAWEIFLHRLPKHAVISVENMDCSKQDFRSLEEIGALLDSFESLRTTFDLCHWIENGSDERSLSRFLERYSCKISKVHYSVPTSEALFYRHTKGIPHRTVYRSDFQMRASLVPILDGRYPIVCEGFIPMGAQRAMKGEVELARSISEQCRRILAAAA